MTSDAQIAGSGRTAPQQRRLGLLLITLSAVFWSTAGLFTRLIPLDGWTTLFWRGLFGAATALLFVLFQERRGAWRAFVGMGWPGLLFAVVSALGMACFLNALKLTTVAHVTIIYATVPFLAAGLAWVVLRERASAATLIASAAALAGVALTVIGGFGEGAPAGDALALLMTLFMAGMIVISRWRRAIPMVPAACLSSLLSSAVSLPFAAPLAAGPADLLNLALFGITNMGLGLILFVLGARYLPAGETALIGALDAPLAPIWVWLAFGETPRAVTVVGGLIVLVAVVGNVLAGLPRSSPYAPARCAAAIAASVGKRKS